MGVYIPNVVGGEGVAGAPANAKYLLHEANADLPGGCSQFVRAGTEAEKPSGVHVQDLYYATDSGNFYRYDGADWIKIATREWSGLDSKPSTFTPSTHTHSKADVTDFGHTHPASDLTATGTKDATTFLRGDNTWASPPSVGGGGGTTVIKKATDQAILGTTLTDVADMSISLDANSSYDVELLVVFNSNISTSGFRFAMVSDTATYSRFLFVLEYQTSATAWATFTQTNPTTYMPATAAAYVANAGIMCRIKGLVTTTLGGTLKLQAAAEVATGTLTVRGGLTLKYV